MQVNYIKESKPKTQKALGIRYLANFPADHVGSPRIPGAVRTALLVTDLENVTMPECEDLHSEIVEDSSRPLFLRPCPIKPRHGFVDSRILYTVDTLLETLQETYSQDNQGELIIMPYLPAKFSAVMTNHYITIGLGNDGVTGGKGNTITYTWDGYANNRDYFRLLRNIARESHEAGIDSEEEVVLELLCATVSSFWEIVQIRQVHEKAGRVTDRYVPEDIEVTNIQDVRYMLPQQAESFLLAQWATVAPGTVFQVNSMRSHVAVQLIAKDYTIIEAHIPLVPGTKLERTIGTTTATPDQFKNFAGKLRWVYSQRLQTFLGSDITNERRVNLRTLADLASAMAKSGTHVDLSLNGDVTMLALGICSMLWISSIACIAEARHFFTKTTSGMSFYGVLHSVFRDKSKSLYAAQVISRDDIFANELPLVKLPKVLTMLSAAYSYHSAKGWGKAYGGEAWANIAKANQDLYNRSRDFIDSPSRENYNKLMTSYNKASYLTHNGGSGALSKVPGAEKSHFCMQEKIGKEFLLHPLQTKEGKLPRIRSIPMNKRISHFRRFPLNGTGDHPEALFYLAPKVGQYMVLLPNTPRHLSNSPIGFVFCGEISPSEGSLMSPSDQNHILFFGVTLTKQTMKVHLLKLPFGVETPEDIAWAQQYFTKPINMVRARTLAKAAFANQLKPSHCNATYKNFVSRRYSPMFSGMVGCLYNKPLSDPKTFENYAVDSSENVPF